ncbi:unnamed protein product [Linum trigynum]|uniref:Uncharacterized protein n=1 Tax=Linum trigynum TaxID=586398 RepID=A0AAV2FRG9_9ROSI
MLIELTNRSVGEARGVIENVLVKCAHFFYPVDFVVLDNEGCDASIIQGQPFLATSRTIIDVRGIQITLRFGDEDISYKKTPIPNLHKYFKWEDVKMDCEPVTPPTTPPSSPKIEWFNMVTHVDPHDSVDEGMFDSCKIIKRPGKEEFSHERDIQELLKVSHQAIDHRRNLKRFIFDERFPKEKGREVKNNLALILEDEEFGECYKSFTDDDTSTREFVSFNPTHQPSDESFLFQAADEESERLHGLHLGLHHKYDLYEGSLVNEGDLVF